MSMFEENLRLLRAWVGALCEAGCVPLTFVDLDDTLNSGFGALIDPHAVSALREVAEAGTPFGMNTGADIVWAGERVLSETQRFFSFPFMVLATGAKIYAWVDSLGAYARLPVRAENKGQALRRLAEYLDLPLDLFIYIADFPGAGDMQEGIDDPVLREPLGVIVNVGAHRPPEQIACVSQQTLLLHPEWREDGLAGTGCQATTQYMQCLAESLRHERHAEQARAFRAELAAIVQRKLGILPALGARDRGERIWTFERRTPAAGTSLPVRIRVGGQGIVHAGVSREGRWTRIYDVPLAQVAPGTWEAALLDPEVNEFTFIWYDPNRSGHVHWEGRNFLVPGLPVADSTRLAP